MPVEGPRDARELAGAFMSVSIEDEIEAIADEENSRPGLMKADRIGAKGETSDYADKDSDVAIGIEDGEVISGSTIRRIFAEGAIVSNESGTFRIDESLFTVSSGRSAGFDSAGQGDSIPSGGGGESDRPRDSLFLGDVSLRPVNRSSRRHHATASGNRRSGASTIGKSTRKGAGVGADQSHDTQLRSSARSEATGPGAGGAQDALLRPDGIDFDRFLRRYRNNDAGIVRALVFFTRRVGAPVALILVPKADGYRGQYSLGLDEGIAKRVHVPENSHFARSVLNERRVFHYEAPLHTLPELSFEANESALGSFKRTLFIPIQFRQRNGYLVLGLPREGQSAEAVLEQVRDTIASS